MANNQTVLSSMPPLPPHWMNVEGLEPPPVPSGLHLNVFGSLFNMSFESRLHQDEQNIIENTKLGKVETRVAALKQLNKKLLVNFLQLTKVLVQSPSEYEEKVLELKATLMNFQYLLNLYRPHEARETIITMLEKQLERRKAVSELLKERIAAADDKVAEAKTRLLKQIARIDSEALPPPAELLSLQTQDTASSSKMEVTDAQEQEINKPLDLQKGLELLTPYLDSL